MYFPRRRFASTEISWSGVLQNLWYYLDPFFTYSYIHEDTVSDRIFNLKQDRIVSMFYNTDTNKTYANLYADPNGNGGANFNTPSAVKEFTTLSSLWEAGKLLWARNLDDDPRRIYTTSDGAHLMDFTNSASAIATLGPLMGSPVINGVDTTGDVIQWTKGYLISTENAAAGTLDYRTRTADIDLNGNGNTNDDALSIDITNDGHNETVSEINEWKLGDVISSTPKIESRFPLQDYWKRYNDPSHDNFVHDKCIFTTSPDSCPDRCGVCQVLNTDDRRRYKNRGMVYTGANDGMLHAFNLGQLKLVGVDEDYGDSADGEIGKLVVPSSEIANSPISERNYLGKEMWAYIPKNALPYLKLMAEPDYCHDATVDLSPFVFDASIVRPSGCTEANDYDCPSTSESWRTVLIGAFRLGGACDKADGTATCTAGTDCVNTPVSVSGTHVGYSSYFALDVTDPYYPSLMWEYSNPELGYSYAGPSVVRISSKFPNGTSKNRWFNGRWFVVIGSGPTGPIDSVSHQFMGQSDRNLKFVVLDLITGSLITTIDTGITNAFAGSMLNITLDSDVDYQDDVLYVGYTKKDTSTGTWSKGGVGRIITAEHNDISESPVPNHWKWSKVMDDIGPVTAAVSKILDIKNGKQWLYFGSGRFFFKKATANLSLQDDMLGTAAWQRTLYGVADPCFIGMQDYTAGTDQSPKDMWAASCTTGNTANNAANVTLANLANVTTTLQNPQSPDPDGWYINLALGDGNKIGAERVITDPLASTAGYVYYTTYVPDVDICKLEGSTYLWAVQYNSGGLPAGIKGTALIQTSTGAIQQVDLKKEFSGVNATASNGYGRRSHEMKGAPPGGQTPIMGEPQAVRRLLYEMER